MTGQRFSKPTYEAADILTKSLVFKSFVLGSIVAAFGGLLLVPFLLVGMLFLGIEETIAKIIAVGLVGVLCGVMGVVHMVTGELANYRMLHKFEK